MSRWEFDDDAGVHHVLNVPNYKPMREALTFDDVLLVPKWSEIGSREYVDTSTKIGNIKLKLPVISANMDSVTWTDMAIAMWRAGGLGILHRFAPRDAVLKAIADMQTAGVPMTHVVPSIGVKEFDLEFVEILRNNAVESICVDVAHGHTRAVHEMVAFCSGLGFKTIIAGNVATLDGAQYLADAGANVIKVGVGPGSVCTTRVMTGHGYPQLSAIMEISRGVRGADVIGDGGIKYPGDIVKALAGGADAVMVGFMLAGCEETPNYQPGMKVYRGSASKGANGNQKYIEGVDTLVTANGPAFKVLGSIEAGLRSGMAYSGANNLSELRAYAEFVKVTNSTVIENGPHGRNS